MILGIVTILFFKKYFILFSFSFFNFANVVILLKKRESPIFLPKFTKILKEKFTTKKITAYDWIN